MVSDIKILSVAMNTIAGTEDTINLMSKEGTSSSQDAKFNCCIDTSSKESVLEEIHKVLNRALSHTNIDFKQAGVVYASNFFELFSKEKRFNRDTYEDSNEILQKVMHKYGFSKIAVCDSTACSSGGSGIVNAIQWMKYGICKYVVVIGMDVKTLVPEYGMKKIGALSKEKIRPFSLERSGTDIAEGIGVIVLGTGEDHNTEMARIIGYGVTQDAYNMTSPNPDGKALLQAMKQAIIMSEVELNEIEYINVHGSGTQLNDSLETQVIHEIFGEHAHKLLINSSKSLIGHTLGASGIIELIITILQLDKGIIHPTANFQSIDEKCDLNYCVDGAVRKQCSNALSNSIGFGGINTCIMVQKRK